ncbi:heat shock 70 kDa protein 12A-like [Mytilus californianus]|uniref:heat shock 70 kDa protein 12A-like n=1 Tax=Mytilus californianus TaxID=6549 RepID=UPI0022471575|nr:heat shock 70 kDa protein 12A-like [Mytilus californianus]
MMEGNLKMKVSLIKGYRDQWFVLTEDGFLKRFSEKPIKENKKPRDQIMLLLSDISVKKDLVSFRVTSANNNVFRLRAANIAERGKWVRTMTDIKTKLYNRMFTGFYNTKERVQINADEENNGNGSDCVFTQVQETVSEDHGIVATETDITSFFKTAKKPFIAVAAIDFGTTFSGCAFSTVQDFVTNPLKITTIELDDENVVSYKTPTVLLLDPEGRFHSFGSKAADHYVNLAEKEEACKWYFFDRFKMQLYKKELTHNMEIEEMGGKKMKAMFVFAFCIEYIKDMVLDRLSKAIDSLDEDDVHWVVTVPAIWNDPARQFMIEASAKAGIGKDNLTLALEPEGAAICCKYIAMDKMKSGDETELKAFDENSRFMVVDLGGGTIDITVSEVLPTGQLREIYNATGGPWGGNYINDQIIKTLIEVIGWSVMRMLKSDDFDDYLQLLRNVEEKKRSVKYDSELSLTITKDLQKKIEIPDTYKKDVRKEKKRIKLSSSLMKKIFSSSVDSMMKHVDRLLEKDETTLVSTILLVGGYAACDFVQRAFREKFEEKYRIIFPLKPDMIVLIGAVITGHLVEAIVGRMAKYHYGLGLSTEAVSGRVLSIGKSNGEKKFFSLIKKGQTINVGDVVTEYKVVLTATSQWANLEVYTTEEDEPKTVIDENHFTKVGCINVKLPQFKQESTLALTISYAETEFKVVATDESTGCCFVGNCQFLEKEIKPTLTSTRI